MENTQPPLKKLVADDEIFNHFWSYYPNKKSGRAKPKALLMKAIKSGVKLETIINSVVDHKLTTRWADPQFIPLATTWLHQQRWEAEFTADDFKKPVNNKDRLSDNSGLQNMLDRHRFDNALPVGMPRLVE